MQTRSHRSWLLDEKTEAWREAAEAEEDKDKASELDPDRLPQAVGGCSTVHGRWTRDAAASLTASPRHHHEQFIALSMVPQTSSL